MRLRGSQETGRAVPTITRKFKTEDDAFDFSIHCQRDRRNLTDADVTRLIGIVDQRMKGGRPVGGSKQLPSCEGNSHGKESATETAAIIGVSRATVERARTIISHADDETKKAVMSGKMDQLKTAGRPLVGSKELASREANLHDRYPRVREALEPFCSPQGRTHDHASCHAWVG